MAGDTIYIGNLFADMISELQTLADKMDTQASKMDTQITKLDSISNNILNDVSAINLVASSNVYKSFSNPETAFAGVDNTDVDTGIRLFSKADGTVKIQFNCTASSIVAFKAKSDGGALVSVATYTGGGSYLFEGTMAVKANSIIEIWAEASSTGTKTIRANSIKILADETTVALQGAFSINI